MNTHRRHSEGTYDRMWRLPSWRRRQEEVWKSTLRFHICLSRRMWRLWPEAGKWQKRVFCGVQTRDPNLRVICAVATDRVEEQAWLVVSPRATDTGAGGQSGSHAPTDLVYFVYLSSLSHSTFSVSPSFYSYSLWVKCDIVVIYIHLVLPTRL